jgi:hypothetical protein
LKIPSSFICFVGFELHFMGLFLQKPPIPKHVICLIANIVVLFIQIVPQILGLICESPQERIYMQSFN